MLKSQRKIGMFLSYIKSLSFVLVNIFLTPFLIKSLGDSEYGIYQMMASFAGYLVLVNFGTGTVMTRYVSIALEEKDKKSEKNYIATCLIITVALGALILIASGVLYAFLESIYSVRLTTEQIEKAKLLYIFIAGNVFVTLFVNTFQGILNAYERFAVSNIWQIIRTFLKALLIILLFSFKTDSVVIVAVDLLLSVFMLVFDIFYLLFRLKVRWKLYFFDKELFTSSALFALANLLQAIVNQANTKVDITVLGIMVSPESTTYYSVAMQVFSVFSTISTAAVAVYLPKFSRMVSDKKTDGETITKAMIAPSRVQLLVSGAIMFGFLVCGKDFINVWMGEEYAFSWIIAVIIMIPNFLVYTNVLVESVLDAMNKRLVRSIVLAGVAVFNIALTIVLVHFFGEIGAPIGTAIATIIGSVIIMNIYYCKVIGIRFRYFCAKVFKGIMPSLFVAAAVSLPFVFMIDKNIVGLLIKGGVFVVSLIICLWLFGLSKEEKSLITGFIKKKRR